MRRHYLFPRAMRWMRQSRRCRLHHPRRCRVGRLQRRCLRSLLMLRGLHLRRLARLVRCSLSSVGLSFSRLVPPLAPSRHSAYHLALSFSFPTPFTPIGLAPIAAIFYHLPPDISYGILWNIHTRIILSHFGLLLEFALVTLVSNHRREFCSPEGSR